MEPHHLACLLMPHIHLIRSLTLCHRGTSYGYMMDWEAQWQALAVIKAAA
jgi:hypothetical protein